MQNYIGKSLFLHIGRSPTSWTDDLIKVKDRGGNRRLPTKATVGTWGGLCQEVDVFQKWLIR